MKLLICCNHSFPHVGGAETVIQSIAEGLVSKWNWEVYVTSFTIPNPIRRNGVILLPCSQDYNQFLTTISSIRPDHVFIYGDVFKHLPEIIRSPKSIDLPISIALVGMNKIWWDDFLFDSFCKNKDSFNIIVHSKEYFDYQVCESQGFDVSVIPNGISLNDFSDTGINFRNKYNFDDEELLLLCVANFFPEKGYEILSSVIESISNNAQRKFRMCVIASSVNHPASISLEEKFRSDISDLSCTVLKNIRREDVIAAFKSSDLFVFPSFKEVAPIVLLESMASSLPFVSFDVGNTEEYGHEAGIVVKRESLSPDDIYPTLNDINKFSGVIIDLMNDDIRRNKIGEKGRSIAEHRYDWNTILPLYHDIFN